MPVSHFYPKHPSTLLKKGHPMARKHMGQSEPWQRSSQRSIRSSTRLGSTGGVGGSPEDQAAGLDESTKQRAPSCMWKVLKMGGSSLESEHPKMELAVFVVVFVFFSVGGSLEQNQANRGTN